MSSCSYAPRQPAHPENQAGSTLPALIHTLTSATTSPSPKLSHTNPHTSLLIFFLAAATLCQRTSSLSTAARSSAVTNRTLPDRSAVNRRSRSSLSASSAVTAARRSAVESVAFVAVSVDLSVRAVAVREAVSVRRLAMVVSKAASVSEVVASGGL